MPRCSLGKPSSKAPPRVARSVLWPVRNAVGVDFMSPTLKAGAVHDDGLGIHVDDPGYGYRSIADELGQAGIVASENRMWRLGSAQAIRATHHRHRGTGRKPGLPVHSDPEVIGRS